MLLSATFLAGSLLSLLLPIILLLALTGWYVWFVRRVPDSTSEPQSVSAEAVAASPTEPAEGSGS